MKDRLTILTGDCRETLKTLASGSVHTCVTSPPYYGLRDYGTGTWEGGDTACTHVVGELRRGVNLAASVASTRGGGHKAAEVEDIMARATCPKCGATRKDQQIGLEDSIEEYLGVILDVFREVKRVLRDDGTLWVNLGDSYANDTKWGGKTTGIHARGLQGTDFIGRNRHLTGLAGKNLMGIPWRVAFALQADGWILRQDIIWHKPNPMPESITDRCTKSHEYIFLFAKQQRYFYDATAILEPVSANTHARLAQNVQAQVGSARANGGTRSERPMKAVRRANLPQGWENSDRYHNTDPRYAKRKLAEDTKNNASFDDAMAIMPESRNKRSVWEAPEELFSQFLQWLEAQPGNEKADVWKVATEGYKDAHFATFPADLIRPCILAGCPTAGKRCDCAEIIATPTAQPVEDGPGDPTLFTGRAGMNRERRDDSGTRPITRREQRWEAGQLKAPAVKEAVRKASAELGADVFEHYWENTFQHYLRTDRIGARPLPENLRQRLSALGLLTPAPPCECPVEPAGVVIDPFGGSGTTGMVALELGRSAILCELNPEYVPMIRRRCDVTPGFDFSFSPTT